MISEVRKNMFISEIMSPDNTSSPVRVSDLRIKKAPCALSAVSNLVSAPALLMSLKYQLYNFSKRALGNTFYTIFNRITFEHLWNCTRLRRRKVCSPLVL